MPNTNTQSLEENADLELANLIQENIRSEMEVRESIQQMYQELNLLRRINNAQKSFFAKHPVWTASFIFSVVGLGATAYWYASSSDKTYADELENYNDTWVSNEQENCAKVLPLENVCKVPSSHDNENEAVKDCRAYANTYCGDAAAATQISFYTLMANILEFGVDVGISFLIRNQDKSVEKNVLAREILSPELWNEVCNEWQGISDKVTMQDLMKHYLQPTMKDLIAEIQRQEGKFNYYFSPVTSFFKRASKSMGALVAEPKVDIEAINKIYGV